MTISPFNSCIYISIPSLIFLFNFKNAKCTIKYPHGVTTTFLHLAFHTYIKKGGKYTKLSALLKMRAKNQSEFRRGQILYKPRTKLGFFINLSYVSLWFFSPL